MTQRAEAIIVNGAIAFLGAMAIGIKVVEALSRGGAKAGRQWQRKP